jgi:hypothetical protein
LCEVFQQQWKHGIHFGVHRCVLCLYICMDKNPSFCRWSGNKNRRWNFITEIDIQITSIIPEYGLTVSPSKTKTMEFRGRDPIRSKVVINNKIIDHKHI